jgi:hypothetical protein
MYKLIRISILIKKKNTSNTETRLLGHAPNTQFPRSFSRQGLLASRVERKHVPPQPSSTREARPRFTVILVLKVYFLKYIF